jgi:hypothetical protein
MAVVLLVCSPLPLQSRDHCFPIRGIPAGYCNKALTIQAAVIKKFSSGSTAISFHSSGSRNWARRSYLEIGALATWYKPYKSAWFSIISLISLERNLLKYYKNRTGPIQFDLSETTPSIPRDRPQDQIPD